MFEWRLRRRHVFGAAPTRRLELPLALLLLSAVTLPAAALQPAGRTPLQQSLASMADVEQRIATIGHRLAVANRDLCGTREWRLGLATHAMSQYEPRVRDEVAGLFGFRSGISVLAVADQGPSARAGLQRGDVIISIDGTAAAASGQGSRRASYAEAEVFLGRLEQAAADGTVSFEIERGQRRVTVPVRGEEGCASRFQLRLSDEIEAAADGRYVQITSRVAELAQGDDELASVAAHELAHNILEHRARLNAAGINRGFLQNFGRSARLTRETEMEADRLSIRLMHRAGYDPRAAVRYLDRVLSRPRLFRGGTHPARQERLAAMQEEIAKLASGGP